MVVLPAAVLTAEESLRGAKMEATTAAAVPKNPRRFHVDPSPMRISLVLLARYGRDAVDFDQRITWQSSDCNGGAGWSPVWEVGGEYLGHRVPVLDLYQENVGLRMLSTVPPPTSTCF